MSSDPLTTAAIQAIAKATNRTLGAASRNLANGLSRLVGSYFYNGVLSRETIAESNREFLQLESKIARERMTDIADAERDIFRKIVTQELNHDSNLDIPQIYLNEILQRNIDRHRVPFLIKEQNFNQAVLDAFIEVENSTNRDEEIDIDPDFLLQWIECVERVSNGELRKIWSRLLAQHATEKHDGLTPHSIDVVRRLRPRLVFLFEKIGPLAWLMGGVEQDVVAGHISSNTEFEELIEIGLLKELEIAKLRFGHLTMTFLQRDEAKRSTHFFGLTQSGRQIFRVLSPSSFRIFDENNRRETTGSGRARVDHIARFDRTMEIFTGPNEAEAFITQSCRNLLVLRKMELNFTVRKRNGKIAELIDLSFSKKNGKSKIRSDNGIGTEDVEHYEFVIGLYRKLVADIENDFK